MRDQFTEAELELQDKSPFICSRCGHPHDITKSQTTANNPASGVHDRFSDAVMEESERSAFVCEKCNLEQEIRR